MEEKRLIEGCKRNKKDCRKLLYDSYSSVLYTICLRYTGDKDQALDLMHDSFIKVFDRIGSFKNEGSFEGWIKRIAVNTSISWLKKRYIIPLVERELESEVEILDVDDPYENVTEEKIVEFIMELPVGYRTVFNMYAVEDYSHKDIAKALNISIGTSLSQYAKAKKILAKKINDYIIQQ